MPFATPPKQSQNKIVCLYRKVTIVLNKKNTPPHVLDTFFDEYMENPIWHRSHSGLQASPFTASEVYPRDVPVSGIVVLDSCSTVLVRCMRNAKHRIWQLRLITHTLYIIRACTCRGDCRHLLSLPFRKAPTAFPGYLRKGDFLSSI